MHRPVPKFLVALSIATALLSLWAVPAAAQTGILVPGRFAADPTGGVGEAGLREWWKSLGDPILDDLIEDALMQNRDLVVAEARVAEAIARRRAAAGEFYPQVDGRTEGARAQSSGQTRAGLFTGAAPTNEFAGLVTARWELDVFGRIRQGVRAAQAQAEAEEERRRDVLVILLAEVASVYLELRGLQAEQTVILENIKSQEDTAELTRVRRDAGVDNSLAVAQAEGQLATTRANLPPIVQRIREAQHRLGTLTGQPPDTYLRSLAKTRALPRGPRQIPAGLPSDLLARRPDVRRAERLVAAAAAQLGQARAARLPSFALTAQTGQQSDEIGDIIERRANLWSFGASMTIPLFTGGTLRENVKAAESVLTQSRATYEQTMLLALEEVETALVRHAETQKTLAALREAEKQARITLTLSTDLYRNGAGSFLNVLEAQRSQLLAQALAVSSERQVALNLVSLYKALGGGWDTATPATTPQDPTTSSPPAPAEPPRQSTAPTRKTSSQNSETADVIPLRR